MDNETLTKIAGQIQDAIDAEFSLRANNPGWTVEQLEKSIAKVDGMMATLDIVNGAYRANVFGAESLAYLNRRLELQ